MNALTHYVVVRRDLPFGVLLAMVAHAAGESFYKLASCTLTVPGNVTMASGACCAGPGTVFPGSSMSEHQTLEAGGSIPPSGSTFDPSTTIAVVLGARNQGRLTKAANILHAAGVPYVEIRETDGEFADQLMAIGVVPTSKKVVAPLLRDYHMFSELQP